MRYEHGTSRRWGWTAWAVGSILMPGILAGCMTTPPASPTWPEPEESRVVLLPGDSVEIEFAYHPELNSSQTIRPDGRISLQLIDEVLAAGLEPEELRQVLKESYAPNLRSPEINVVVTSFESSRVYVGGEVQAPGVYPMPGGRLTALEAVMLAGGFQARSARMSEAVVIRRRGDEQFATAINLREAIENPESAPFHLEPLDVVFIPRTRIDHVNQWVDQYINNIVPRNVQMSFWYDVRGQQRDGQSGTTRSLSTNISPNIQVP